MNRENEDLDFEQKLKEGLDMGVDDDKALNDRFAEMRLKALNEIPEKKVSRFWSLTVPSIGIAASAFVMVVVMLLPAKNEDANFALNELDVLIEAEDLEMLEAHDLEFYVWLEGELAIQNG